MIISDSLFDMPFVTGRDMSRGGLGLKIGPGNFPMTFHPTGPTQAKLSKMTVSLLTPYRPTGY